jgi:AraC family transcriptional regulator of adaptative response / DNA-3-methyladenine glycosylase II
MKRDDIYYAVMLARDHRFDGKFFVGVKTTGIYCRPICPARPKRENVEFFRNHLEAEKAGYRPCLRCRPESAPQSPAWIGKSAVVIRAIRVLLTHDTLEFDEDTFASMFGVTARHLRRLFVEEIGKTPKELAYENRINLARQLIVESALPITEIAFASGFSSIRRFNDAFKNRFKKSPREIRRNKVKPDGLLKISLPYRPPFDFEGLMKSYESHRVGNLEHFENGKMHRIVAIGNIIGEISLANDPENFALNLQMNFSDYAVVYHVIAKVKNLFDLQSDPIAVANTLETNPAIKKLLKKYPGIRLASGWDPFETAIGAILGQSVSVGHGRALVNQLIEIAGREIKWHDRYIKLFPTCAEILTADLSKLKTTAARRQALLAFVKAIHEKRISLEPTQDVALFVKSLRDIKGIGAWTASVMALKVLRDADTFPGTDLILARALAIHPQAIIDGMSPWRGYAAALLWRAYASLLAKNSRVDKVRKQPV